MSEGNTVVYKSKALRLFFNKLKYIFLHLLKLEKMSQGVRSLNTWSVKNVLGVSLAYAQWLAGIHLKFIMGKVKGLGTLKVFDLHIRTIYIESLRTSQFWNVFAKC